MGLMDFLRGKGKPQTQLSPEEVRRGLLSFLAVKRVQELLAKGESYRKLGQGREAEACIEEAIRISKRAVTDAPKAPDGYMMLIYAYVESGRREEAQRLIERVLAGQEVDVDGPTRTVLQGQLLLLERERPWKERAEKGLDDSYTQVYCCNCCGRLINYVTHRCPHCGYIPENQEALLNSICLSTNSFSIPQLILLGCEISKGRPSSDVVPNLASTVEHTRRILSGHIDGLMRLLEDGTKKASQLFQDLNRCESCTTPLLFSKQEQCTKCGYQFKLPKRTQALICINNLLWCMERRHLPYQEPEAKEFIMVLVKLFSKVFKDHIPPSRRELDYALQLMFDVRQFPEAVGGGLVVVASREELYAVVNDSMPEDTQVYTQVFAAEVGCLMVLASESV